MLRRAISHLSYIISFRPRYLGSSSGVYSFIERDGLKELKVSVDGRSRGYLFDGGTNEHAIDESISKDYQGVNMKKIGREGVDNREIAFSLRGVSGILLSSSQKPPFHLLAVFDQKVQFHSDRSLIELYETGIRCIDELLGRYQPDITKSECRSDMSRLREMAVKASRLRWTGLGLMGFQFGFLFELIWNTYSWDIMEPVTYFITFTSSSFAAYCYFVLFKQDFEYSKAASQYLALNKRP